MRTIYDKKQTIHNKKTMKNQTIFKNDIESLLSHMQDSYISLSDIQAQALEEYKSIKERFKKNVSLDEVMKVNGMLDNKMKAATEAVKFQIEISKIHERLVKNEINDSDKNDDGIMPKMNSDWMKDIKREIQKMDKDEEYDID